MDLTNMLKQYVALQTESINTLKNLYLDVQANEADIENNQTAVENANTALEVSKQNKINLLDKITKKEEVLEQCNFRLGILTEQLEFFATPVETVETATATPSVETVVTETPEAPEATEEEVTETVTTETTATTGSETE